MDQRAQELLESKIRLIRSGQETIPPHINVMITEADILGPEPLSSPRTVEKKSRWRQWWTEERLALFTLVVGNISLFALVLWWLM
jgi:hypothetical protein